MGSFSNTLHLFILLHCLVTSHANHETAIFKGVNLESPSIVVTPSTLSDHPSSHGSKVSLCERVQVFGLSRLKLKSYASSFQITLSPSTTIPEKLHRNIQVCFHQNKSLGLCQCKDVEWKSFKGVWNSIMSPYEVRYIDVKFIDKVFGSIIIAIEEDFQQWRLICLVLGFALLLLAPLVSNWAPFYYCSSMVIGVFLVIIIMLFQGMKLLPTIRKNVFYLTIYGSLLVVGPFLLNHFSMLVNSILVKFGLNKEMYNPVYIFWLVGIILLGAALGRWMVRKFVISTDGKVDVRVAQFVKWAMRIIGTTFILQSSLDTSLALVTLASCWVICKLIFFLKKRLGMMNATSWLKPKRETLGKHGRTEFLSRSSPHGKMWNTRTNVSAWSNSPVRGVIFPSIGATNQQAYYSSFCKKHDQKKFTKQEWDDFTRESTRQAIAEWASSPEVSDWMIKKSNRIKLLSRESSDETLGSDSDSTNEYYG